MQFNFQVLHSSHPRSCRVFPCATHLQLSHKTLTIYTNKRTSFVSLPHFSTTTYRFSDQQILPTLTNDSFLTAINLICDRQMAQPTQQFPPWLSYSPIIFTDAAGAPVSTTSTIVYLPLTYYGPSVSDSVLFTKMTRKM
jgi:hypothetical protein